MTTIDLPHLRQWLGRGREDRDVLAVRHARLMAATLGQDQAALAEGARLPPLWHWLYFLEARPPSELGPDGHPALGGFLPPVPLGGRMWAGGRVAFLAPLPLGAVVDRRSEVIGVEHKAGRSGDLVFVTVRHELFHEGTPALAEEHDIVYRDPAAARPSRPPKAAPPAAHRKTLVPDSTLLFRYSALTFNGHRIHYDADYCRAVEGYPDLVVHGPLSATLLAGFAEEIGGRELRHFAYRGLRPAFRGPALTLNAAAPEDGRLDLWTALPDGSVSMRAEAVLA
ncbi:MAG TPA: protein dehydratase [Geminicoccaceae bacterium]|nr:protein dehydratase [Geminicoccaceae bacterium]